MFIIVSTFTLMDQMRRSADWFPSGRIIFPGPVENLIVGAIANCAGCHHGGVDRYLDDDPDDWDDDEPAAEADSASGASDDAAEEPEHSLTTVGRAASPTGSIEVRTTMQGLPTSIHIERSEMDGSAAKLAKTILLLCKQAGARAGANHRAALLREGHTLEAVSYTGLPSEREAADVDRLVDNFFDEDETGTWLRRV